LKNEIEKRQKEGTPEKTDDEIKAELPKDQAIVKTPAAVQS
jgi:hypothetical protein